MAKFEIRSRLVGNEIVKGESVESFEPAIDIEADVYIDDDTYSNKITMGLKRTDGKGPEFSESFIVIHKNHQNGFQVDAQRKKEIEIFLTNYNQ